MANWGRGGVGGSPTPFTLSRHQSMRSFRLDNSRPASFRFVGGSPRAAFRRGQSFGGGQFPIRDTHTANDPAEMSSSGGGESVVTGRSYDGVGKSVVGGGYAAQHNNEPLFVPSHLLGRSSPLNIQHSSDEQQPAHAASSTPSILLLSGSNNSESGVFEKQPTSPSPTAPQKGLPPQRPPLHTSPNPLAVASNKSSPNEHSTLQNSQVLGGSVSFSPGGGASSNLFVPPDSRPSMGVVWVAAPSLRVSDDGLLSAASPDSCNETGTPGNFIN